MTLLTRRALIGCGLAAIAVGALSGWVVTATQVVLQSGGLTGVQRADRALQHRGVGAIELQAFGGHQLATGLGFGAALFGEVDVDPAGEAIFEVPLALAMAQQDQARHAGLRL